jgi:tRNA(Phe) wybutosine-synthesizing methylase Tyw3
MCQSLCTQAEVLARLINNSNYQLETHSSCASRVQLVQSPSAHFARNHLTAKHTKPNQLVYVLYETSRPLLQFIKDKSKFTL